MVDRVLRRSRSARGQHLTTRQLDAAMDYAGTTARPPSRRIRSTPTEVPAAVGDTGLLSTFVAAGFRVVHEIDSPQATVRRVIVRRDA